MGDTPDIIDHPSPNFGDRRHGRGPDMVVLHHTAMTTCGEAIARLCDPATEVSAHYVITEDGAILRLVAEKMRAWHAGGGAWGVVSDINSHSIGIEICNAGPLDQHPPYPEVQMAALEALLPGILARHGIAPARVIAHSDMAPERKWDPGAKFDWRRLAMGGLSIWPGAGGDTQADFFESAARIGYRLPAVSDDPKGNVLGAFRLRFRPGATGAVNGLDRALADDLARRYPGPDTA